MVHLIRRYLRAKILLALIVLVTFIMGIVIYVNIHSQERSLFKKAHEFSSDIARLTYAGIKRPMARGNSEMVEEQLRHIKDSMEGVEVYICDFDKKIIYASQPEAINHPISEFIFNEEARKYLEEMLETGHAPSVAFEEKMSKKPSLAVFLPIFNEKGCYHCHGTSRKVLGGLIVKQSITGIYDTINSLRNHNVLIGIGGILGLICLGYFFSVKWISRPTRELAEKTARIAEGDFSVSMTTDREDSIGILIKNFNIMTKKIKDQIEYANSLKFSIPEPFFITDPDFTITYMNEALERLIGHPRSEVEGKKKCYEIVKSDLCEADCFFKKAVKSGGVIMGRRGNVKGDGRDIPVIISGAPLKDSTGRIWGGFHFLRDISMEVEAEKAIKEAAAKEEAQRIYLERRVKKLADLFAKIAQGDLTGRAEMEGKGDMMDKLAHHINEMLDNISKIIEQAKEEALLVAERASEISANNQDLSKRTQKQAVSVEEVSAAIQEMTAIINQNAKNTAKVNELARLAVNAAKEGGKIAMDAISSMERIEKMSNRIAEIINLVNEITFQTKLLSLNASVEAARAGEQGKGFAVIASEIKDLAIRSTESAQDIQSLLQESTAKVSEGINFVNTTSENLQKIINHITKVSELIAEIAMASKQQTKEIEHINETVTEINKVIQQNAAFVEELTSASERLSNEADVLLELTRGFITSETSSTEVKEREFLADHLIKKAGLKEVADSPRDLDSGEKFEEF